MAEGTRMAHVADSLKQVEDIQRQQQNKMDKFIGGNTGVGSCIDEVNTTLVQQSTSLEQVQRSIKGKQVTEEQSEERLGRKEFKNFQEPENFKKSGYQNRYSEEKRRTERLDEEEDLHWREKQDYMEDRRSEDRRASRRFDDTMEALTRLRQNSTVALYKHQFEILSNRLEGLSEKYKLSCFLGGLKDEIRSPLKLLNPTNLNWAFTLAKIQEELVLNSRTSKFSTYTNSNWLNNKSVMAGDAKLEGGSRTQLNVASVPQVESVVEEIPEQKDQSTFEKDKQLHNLPTLLEGVDDQQSVCFGALNQNDDLEITSLEIKSQETLGHKDEFLDRFLEKAPMKFQNLHLCHEKAESPDRIKKGTGNCVQQNQDIKNDELLEPYDAEKVLDKNLEIKLIVGVIFIWNGCWIFDPGKKSFSLDDSNRSGNQELPAILVCENTHYGMGTTEWRAAKSPSCYKSGNHTPGLKHRWRWKNLYVICRVFTQIEMEKHGHSSCKRNDKEHTV
jgi:hypothetical protein